VKDQAINAHVLEIWHATDAQQAIIFPRMVSLTTCPPTWCEGGHAFGNWEHSSVEYGTHMTGA
jgi:hypothetical protein